MTLYLKPLPKPLHKTGPNCTQCVYRRTSIGYVGVEGSLDSQFLFLVENPNGPEIEAGSNIVSSKKTIQRLLRENSEINLSEQAIASTCRCWPIAWDSNGKPQMTSYNKKIGEKWYKIRTYVKEKPSPGQVRECASRYTQEMMDAFTGKYIIALGKTPTSFMLGGNVSIKEKRGTPYVSGSMIPCKDCLGCGTVERSPIKCKACKDGKLKCEECGRWKHLKKCSRREDSLAVCAICSGRGEVSRSPKTCKNCSASGKIPKDPKNPFICDKLKDGQIFFPTYAPGMMIKQPTLESIIARDFRVMSSLDDIVSPDVEMLDYHEFPEYEVARGFVYA